MACSDCVHFLPSMKANASRPGLVGYGYCKAAPDAVLRALLLRIAAGVLAHPSLARQGAPSMKARLSPAGWFWISCLLASAVFVLWAFARWGRHGSDLRPGLRPSHWPRGRLCHMATSRGQEKAETPINTGLRPNQAFTVRANRTRPPVRVPASGMGASGASRSYVRRCCSTAILPTRSVIFHYCLLPSSSAAGGSSRG